MTRTIAIFFIAIHLMNVIGIYGIIAHLEAAHQEKISGELDEDEYAGSETITLRIPFSLPNAPYSKNYERVSGKIEYEGQIYYMVKHKYHDNTLFIVCVKDAKAAEINDAYRSLANSMTDKHDGQSSDKAIVIAPIKDFEECHTVELNTTLIQLESLQLPEYTFSTKVNSQSPLDQPPRG